MPYFLCKMKVSSSNSEFGIDLSRWLSFSYFAVLISIGPDESSALPTFLVPEMNNRSLLHNCTIGQICCFPDQEILCFRHVKETR